MSLTLLFLAILVVAAAWLRKRSADAAPIQLGVQISLAGHPVLWQRPAFWKSPTNRQSGGIATLAMWQPLAVSRGPVWAMLSLQRKLVGAPSFSSDRRLRKSTRRWLMLRTAPPLVATLALMELLRLKTPTNCVGFDLVRLPLCLSSEKSRNNTL